jgi:hypothetical protein
VNKILVTDGAGNCGEHPSGALSSSKPLSGFKTALRCDETGAQPPLHLRMSSSPADESRRHAYPQQLPHPIAANLAKGDASTFQLPPPIWGSPALAQMAWEGQRNGNPGARRAIQKALDSGQGCQGLQKALEVGGGGQGSSWDGIQKTLGGSSDYSISLPSSPAPAGNQRRGVTSDESFDMPHQPHHRRSIAHCSWTTPPMVGPSSSLSLSPGGSESSSAGSGTFCVSAYGKDLVLSVSGSSPPDSHTCPRTLSHLPTHGMIAQACMRLRMRAPRCHSLTSHSLSFPRPALPSFYASVLALCLRGEVGSSTAIDRRFDLFCLSCFVWNDRWCRPLPAAPSTHRSRGSRQKFSKLLLYWLSMVNVPGR